MSESDSSSIIWEFQAKDKDSEELVNYQIKKLPEDRFQDATEFLLTYFLPEEAMCECKKIVENAEAVEFGIGLAQEILSENVSVGCFKEDSDDIIAANLLLVLNKEDCERMYEKIPEPFVEILSVTKIAEQLFDVYDHYNVENILRCHGMAVHRDYRGRGIATEMFKARVPLLKSLGLTVTSAECTGMGSQIAAKRAGYDENLSLNYEDLHTYQPGLYFDGIKHKHFKVMSLKID